MKTIPPAARLALTLVLGGLLSSMEPAWADKPVWAGVSKDGKPVQEDLRSGREKERHSGKEGRADTRGRHFSADQYSLVREYYEEHYRGRHCPPGLAKKSNGCMPPGQAKKWKLGHVLPREVIYHPLPSSLVVKIGLPPSGHRYVRVAGDILMIAVGTGMVIDAIEDLGRMM